MAGTRLELVTVVPPLMVARAAAADLADGLPGPARRCRRRAIWRKRRI
jgi:hypothetical protein